jgi:hypothetical protein
MCVDRLQSITDRAAAKSGNRGCLLALDKVALAAKGRKRKRKSRRGAALKEVARTSTALRPTTQGCADRPHVASSVR